MKKFGIDISFYQGDFSLDKAKNEGVEFVIIKGGGADAGIYTDSQYENNYRKAKALNLPVGAYWFTHAANVAEAKAEAQHFLKLLSGKQFELPVYVDVEGSYMRALGRDRVTDVVIAFLSELEAAGYWAGVYASLSWFTSYMNDSRLQQYAHWVAQYATECNYNNREIAGIWQFGGSTNYVRSNKVAGKTVDQNYMYVDYPGMIKAAGLNGFPKPGTTPEPKPSQDQDLAVITTPEPAGLTAEHAIAIARSVIGYHEKASNSSLDDYIANAGHSNWNMFARDLDNLGDFYNGPKNGYAWCDVWVDWIIYQAAGRDKAKAMNALCQPSRSSGAGCSYSAGYYKAAGRWSKTPQPGAQIFFSYYSGSVEHTGLVEAVDSERGIVTTIEGNANDQVKRCTYAIGDPCIYGYGLPRYDADTAHEQDDKPQQDPSIIVVEKPAEKPAEDPTACTVTLPIIVKGMTGEAVRAAQRLLVANGCSVGRWGCDGECGGATYAAVRAYQSKTGLPVTGEIDLQTWRKLLGVA